MNEFTEAQEIAIKEIVDRKVAEAIDKLLAEYDIREKPLTPFERDEEDSR